GAGGAARAVVFGLLGRAVERVHVVNRTFERAKALADRFGGQVRPFGGSELDGLLADAGLLVNTTSLGMSGQPELAIDLAPLPADAVVADLVYAPLKTALLADARRRGLRAVDGLGMLLHQAVGAFARRFNLRPQITTDF